MADQYADWIAVDWGTTRLRAWIMDRENAVMQHLSSSEGMGGLARDEFEPALVRLVDRFLSPDRATQVVACGMVGAKQGWAEADYVGTPCPPPDSINATSVPTKDKRLKVKILPGISQGEPADVMRGEETQIAGFLGTQSNFTGTVCLPGTHSKWVRITDGTVTKFNTVMTGELFAALSEHTVLRHSLGSDAWDEDAFDTAVGDGFEAPEKISASLFNIRAQSLLADLSADAAFARLSGLLLGLELAGTREYRLESPTILIGGTELCLRYAGALEQIGCATQTETGDKMVLAGLIAAYKSAGDI